MYYDLYKKWYEEYLAYGGFPEVVIAPKADDKQAYLKDILNSHIELDVKLLGDVKGKKILHLQCHFGQDTLSLSRLGANATGVDLSDNAINKAKES